MIDVLSILHPEAKKNSLRRMIDHGRVLVDGKRATRAKETVSIGAVIKILSLGKRSRDPLGRWTRFLIPVFYTRIGK